MSGEEKEGPVSNIKEYIVNARKNGFPDTVIIENLKKTNWPDDIIESAIKEADKVIPEVTEEEKKEEETKESPEEEKKEEQPKEETKEEKKEEKADSDLLTKPPEGIFPGKEHPQADIIAKKKFSFLALIALLLSPIPFIGLGVAMAAIDNIRKNNKSGTILAILALIINVIVILGIIYIIFQIFTLPSENLVGFSKYVSDMFNIVP